MRARLDDREGEKLKNFWGVLSEEYLHWLWDINYLGPGRYLSAPLFQDGSAAFDACLIEGSTLSAFEYKTSSLTTVAKHSFDPQAFG